MSILFLAAVLAIILTEDEPEHACLNVLAWVYFIAYVVVRLAGYPG